MSLKRIFLVVLLVVAFAGLTGCPHKPYEEKVDVIYNIRLNWKHAGDDTLRFLLLDRPSMLYPEFVNE
jgi:hypothetical protein